MYHEVNYKLTNEKRVNATFCGWTYILLQATTNKCKYINAIEYKQQNQPKNMKPLFFWKFTQSWIQTYEITGKKT